MAKAVFQMTAEDQDAVRSLMKLVESQRRLESETRKTNRQTKQQKGMLDGFAKYAASFASIGAAIGGVNQVLQRMGTAGQAAARGVEGIEDSLKRLVQISKSSEALEQNIAYARKLSDQHRVPVGAAMDIVYEASNQKRLDQAGFYAQIQKFTDARQVMKGVAQVQNVFGAGAGTDQQLVNQLLTAAGASDLSIEDLAAATKRAAPAAKRIGASDEELLGAVGVLASPAGGGEMAATGIRAMATEAARSGFRGKGLDAAFEHFAQMPTKKREKLLQGREEFAQGYVLYEQNRAAIQDAVRAQQQASDLTGTPDGEVTRRLAQYNQVPFLQDFEATKSAENRLANERMFGAAGKRAMREREALASGTLEREQSGAGPLAYAAESMGESAMERGLGARAVDFAMSMPERAVATGIDKAAGAPIGGVIMSLVNALRENTRAQRGAGGQPMQTE